MDDKLVSLEAVKRTLEKSYYGEATLGELLEDIDNIIAAPQPMSAVEFLDFLETVCTQFAANKLCEGCPLVPWCRHNGVSSAEAVAIAEKWMKEHPEERSEQ